MVCASWFYIGNKVNICVTFDKKMDLNLSWILQLGGFMIFGVAIWFYFKGHHFLSLDYGMKQSHALLLSCLLICLYIFLR